MKEFEVIDCKSIGNALKIYRKANRFTQQKIADYLGLDRSTYAKYEASSRKPEIDVIIKLAALYHVSLDDFMSGFLVGTEQNVLAMSPKNDVPQILSSEESRLIMLYRNSVRKAQILKTVEDIYCEDSEIVDDIKEN